MLPKFMTPIARLVLLASASLLSSCGSDKKNGSYEEAAGHYLQAQHDYCSTNFFVAEQGLAKYRQWLSDTNHPCEPWFNRDQDLFQVNARLFMLKEALGDTNTAELCYQEAAKAYSRFRQRQRLPAQMLSKEEVRERLNRQEKGLDIGWKRQGVSP